MGKKNAYSPVATPTVVAVAVATAAAAGARRAAAAAAGNTAAASAAEWVAAAAAAAADKPDAAAAAVVAAELDSWEPKIRSCRSPGRTPWWSQYVALAAGWLWRHGGKPISDSNKGNKRTPTTELIKQLHPTTYVPTKCDSTMLCFGLDKLSNQIH